MAIEDRVVQLLAPLDRLADGVEGFVNGAMERIPEIVPPGARRILFKAQQNSLGEALAADIIELIPFVGPVLDGVGGLFRMRDATRRGETNTVTRIGFDVVLPIPSNTRRYVRSKLGKGA